MVDLVIKGTNSTIELTQEIAQIIYGLIINSGNADLAVKEQNDSKYDPEHFNTVDKEIDRILTELKKYKSGNVLLSEAEFDSEGVMIKEPIYYEYTTDIDLAKQVSSDLLDITQIISDLL